MKRIKRWMEDKWWIVGIAAIVVVGIIIAGGTVVLVLEMMQDIYERELNGRYYQ